MQKIKMVTSDKVVTVRYWDETGTLEYEDMDIYATVHILDGAVAFFEPFAIMTDNDGKVYRHYYNRERVNSNIEILEMFEF